MTKHEDIAPALPPVSVIMPVFNGERYVAKAIESILNQTHKDFEFIIVDDGSTDSTPAILAAYAARDARIIVCSQSNQDQPASLNRALSLAQHEWIAVIDHDDISLPTRLERQLRFLLQHPEVRVLGTHVIYIDAAGNRIGSWRGGPTTLLEFKAMRGRNERIGIIHPSAMLHRPTILALGGYRAEFGASADSELWSRVTDEHVMLTLPEPLVLYRKHSGSMSMTRFGEQKRVGRWIRARQRARRQGLPEPTYAEHLRAERGFLGLGSLIHQRSDRLRHYTRLRRLAIREGQFGRALVLRVRMALLDPITVVKAVGRRTLLKRSSRRAKRA